MNIIRKSRIPSEVKLLQFEFKLLHITFQEYKETEKDSLIVSHLKDMSLDYTLNLWMNPSLITNYYITFSLKRIMTRVMRFRINLKRKYQVVI